METSKTERELRNVQNVLNSRNIRRRSPYLAQFERRSDSRDYRNGRSLISQVICSRSTANPDPNLSREIVRITPFLRISARRPSLGGKQGEFKREREDNGAELRAIISTSVRRVLVLLACSFAISRSVPLYRHSLAESLI